jgi:competence protein ComEC
VAKAIVLALGDKLLAERERWPLWLPVFQGIGIGIYFAMPVEPPSWAGLAVLALAILLVVLARRSLGLLSASVALMVVVLGFTVVQWRTVIVAAPAVERMTGALHLQGTISEVELLPDGGARVTIDRVQLDRDDVVVPFRVRIKMKKGAPPMSAGQHVSARAMLMPPPQPAMPGAFDFARFAYYHQFGAVGSALDPPEVLPAADEEGGSFGDNWTIAVNDLRHSLSSRILAVLPGDRGAVAEALMTGDQLPISAPLMQAYRDSGLAHILSISGLHITLAAGLIFVALRTALALIPPIALRYPIKKWSAALAILAAWGYTILAGSPVPALRSLFMTGIILAAVLVDRVALSMRLVAFAAVAVMLWTPEEMIGPSFQMSFAAVVALISAYEVLTPKQGAWRAAHPGFLYGIGLYVLGVVSSTLIAGTATAIYGVYHFNRFAVYSVVANMIAVPLTGFWVMPWALLAFLLMPLGLEAVALVPMGWGVEGVNRVAVWVASFPLAAVSVPILPLPGMLVFTFGGCWLLLWKTRWRRWGLPVMVAGLAPMAFANPPDLLVDSHGDAFAVRTTEGALLHTNKGGRILKDTWVRRAGPDTPEHWPKHSSSRDGRLRCDPLGCVWRANGHVVAIVKDEDLLEDACGSADIIVSSVPLRGACRGARVIIDRFDLWRRGPHALWIRPDGVRVESVAEWQGDRPWSWHPHARPKKADALFPPPRPAGVAPEAPVNAEGADGDY